MRRTQLPGENIQGLDGGTMVNQTHQGVKSSNHDKDTQRKGRERHYKIKKGKKGKV